MKLSIIRTWRAGNKHSRLREWRRLIIPVVRVSHLPVVHFSSRTFATRSTVTDEIVSRAAAAYPAHPAKTIELKRMRILLAR